MHKAIFGACLLLAWAGNCAPPPAAECSVAPAAPDARLAGVLARRLPGSPDTLWAGVSAAQPQPLRCGEGWMTLRSPRHAWQAELRTRPFDPRLHDTRRLAEGLIDGRPALGIDRDAPATELAPPSVSFGGQRAAVPDTAWNDLHQMQLCCCGCMVSGQIHPRPYVQVLLSPDGRRLWIFLQGSDGAAGYWAAWAFRDGEYLGRMTAGPA